MDTPGQADKDLQLGVAVVDLADALVEDFDVVEVATQVVNLCVEVVGVHSAGILLTDAAGDLRLLAASSEETAVIETFQVKGDDGPCIDAFRTDQPVSADDPGEIRRRWPFFSAAAEQEGIASVFAVPLRLRGKAIGSLNLFLTRAGSLDDAERRRATALAGMATIAISQAETVRTQGDAVRQLQRALDTRVVIEQAKGVLVATTGRGMDDAFGALRRHARSTNRRLADVAQDVVDGRLGPEDLLRVTQRTV